MIRGLFRLTKLFLGPVHPAAAAWHIRNSLSLIA